MRNKLWIACLAVLVAGVASYAAETDTVATAEPVFDCDAGAVGADLAAKPPQHCNCVIGSPVFECPLFSTCQKGPCRTRPGRPFDGVCTTGEGALAVSLVGDVEPADAVSEVTERKGKGCKPCSKDRRWCGCTLDGMPRVSCDPCCYANDIGIETCLD